MNLMTLISSDVMKKKEVAQSTAIFNTNILVIICKLVITSFSLAAVTVRMLARGLAIYCLQGRASHFAGCHFQNLNLFWWVIFR